MENSVISELNFISIDDKHLNQILKNYKFNSINDQRAEELKNLLVKNNKAISNLLDNLSLASDKDTSKLILSKIETLSNENKKLQEELDEKSINAYKNSEILHTVCNLISCKDNLVSVIHSLNLEEKKLFLNSIIENAYWYGSKNELVIKLLN